MKTHLWRLSSVLLLTLCLQARIRAAEGTPVWTNIFKGAGNSEDKPRSMVVDSSGNVYVTGYALGSGGNSDYATIKYSTAGVPLWTNLFNRLGNSYDFAYSLAVAGNGDVYVTGTSYATGSGNDYATIKCSAAGVPLWTNLFNGAGNSHDYALSLAVDGNGNVIVTGYAFGSGSGNDYAAIKYSAAGVPLWTNLFNGAGNSHDYALSLAVDGNGNVIVTGYAFGSGSGNDYATIKYSAAGVPLWTNLFKGAGNGDDKARSLAVDASGNVYLTGYATGNGSSHDYATMKYSAAGAPLWTNLFNGATNSQDYAVSLALDGKANVYVTGYSFGIGSGFDYVTIKYSTAGVPLWTNMFNGAGNNDDQACSLAVDSSGNVVVTGYSRDSGGHTDFATIKYSTWGVALWTNLFTGDTNSDNYPSSLAVDGSGNVYVTGYSVTYIVNFGDYVTIKYSGPSPAISASKIVGGSLVSTVTGLIADQKLISSASTNLTSWTPIQTNIASGSSLTVTNPYSPDVTKQFYRILVQ